MLLSITWRLYAFELIPGIQYNAMVCCGMQSFFFFFLVDDLFAHSLLLCNNDKMTPYDVSYRHRNLSST